MTTIESHWDSKLTWFNVLGVASRVLDLMLLVTVARAATRIARRHVSRQVWPAEVQTA